MTKRKKAKYPTDNWSEPDGACGPHGFRGSTALTPERAAALRVEAAEILAGTVSAGSMTSDMASIEVALQGIVDVETMDKIGDLVVRAPAQQVIGMLALAKLIKEGRA